LKRKAVEEKIIETSANASVGASRGLTRREIYEDRS